MVFGKDQCISFWFLQPVQLTAWKCSSLECCYVSSGM